jgi:hypothetical protein
MNEPKVSIRLRVAIVYQIILEMIRKNVGMAMLVAGTFVLGYAVKNMEDAQDRKQAHDTIVEVQKSMAAECDARLVDANKAFLERMDSRDKLLAEQGARLDEQSTLINMIGKRQKESIDFNHKEMGSIKKAATEAKTEAKIATTEAKTAAVVVQKGVTEKDRLVINKKVTEKAK